LYQSSKRCKFAIILTNLNSISSYGKAYYSLTLKPELSEEEKLTVKNGIKQGLEGLVGKVPGLIDAKVNIYGRLDSSNADVMLDSTLESPEALKAYAQHPEHVAVANNKVRPYTVSRTCLDFEI